MSQRIHQSKFINPLAWFLITCSGAATLVTFMQSIMVSLVFSKVFSKIHLPPLPENTPKIFSLFVENVHCFFYAGFVFSMLGLIASIGLLKRKNWARILIIALMIGFIIFQILSGVFSFQVVDQFPSTEGAPFDVKLIARVIQIGTLLFSLVLIVFVVWVIKKLSTAPVINEFTFSRH